MCLDKTGIIDPGFSAALKLLGKETEKNQVFLSAVFDKSKQTTV